MDNLFTALLIVNIFFLVIISEPNCFFFFNIEMTMLCSDTGVMCFALRRLHFVVFSSLA